MDEKKKMEGGFGTSTDRPREVWGAADRDGSSGRFAAGEVRDSRDLTDSERGQLLSGYTTGGEEDAPGAASNTGRGGAMGADVSYGMSSGSSERRAGEFSTVGTSSPLGGTSEAGSFGVGSAGDVSFAAGTQDTGSMDHGRMAGAKEKVKEKAGEAKAKVAQSARAQVNQRKDVVADRLEGASGQLQEKLNDKATELVSQVASMADTYVSRATQLLREKDADQLMSMARDEFRTRPLAVAAGCFALGFLGARLLKQ